VRVVAADLRRVPLPRRDFLVVASIPFSLTTYMMRRLLGDPAVPLAGGQLIVALGAARWLSCVCPRDAETAWWAARYEMRLARRVSSASFAPPPGVDAAQLSTRRRPDGPGSASERPGGAGSASQRLLRQLLAVAYRNPDSTVPRLARDLGRGWQPPAGRERSVRRALAGAGIDPGATAGMLTAAEWHRIGQLLGARAGLRRR
jgi:23S rRNA (adenine-N6)-dimethyltransferase